MNFMEANVKWLSSWKLGDKPWSPGGWEYGVDRADAERIYEALRSGFEAAGASVPGSWKPANAYQERRVVNAYRSRGLAA